VLVPRPSEGRQGYRLRRHDPQMPTALVPASETPAPPPPGEGHGGHQALGQAQGLPPHVQVARRARAHRTGSGMAPPPQKIASPACDGHLAWRPLCLWPHGR